MLYVSNIKYKSMFTPLAGGAARGQLYAFLPKVSLLI